MAVIAISRQVAAFGDEIARVLVNKLGYSFIDRHMIENKIIELGFPEEKLKKYDEKKPGFFASLTKERDEYFSYLQLAILEAANQGNCILIGRGAYLILENVPNIVSVRLVSPLEIRKKRIMAEFNWSEKQALQRIEESDTNRAGFHKSFFNEKLENSTRFCMVLNTGFIDMENASALIAGVCKKLITPVQEKKGKKRIFQMLEAHRLVNTLLFEYQLNINFLQAVIDTDKVVLQGVADSVALSEQAVKIAKELMPEKKIVSVISVVQDFKAYP
ncbi:MAG TPA: cytidylate kinase-like family protein [Treponemataceae bacterium]|nr:cytidylate kinase-like family protein [Treponemataceae bacterium]